MNTHHWSMGLWLLSIAVLAVSAMKLILSHEFSFLCDISVLSFSNQYGQNTAFSAGSHLRI